MLEPEAQWLGRYLARLEPERLFPLLNVGSSTAQLRERDQPWIDREVFAPLRRRGGRIVHLDMKPDPGVDVVGDLDDPVVWDEIRARGVRSVLCSNVLEHVAEPRALAAKLVALVPPGGFLVVTVPHRFPYHPDPIDTRFRPSVDELVPLFPTARLLHGAEVRCGTVFSLLRGNALRLGLKSLKMIFGRTAPTDRTDARAVDRGRLREWLIPWAWQPFETTCVILERV